MRCPVLPHGMLACGHPLINRQVAVAIHPQGCVVLPLGLCVVSSSAVKQVTLPTPLGAYGLETIQLVRSEHRRSAINLHYIVHCAYYIEHNGWPKKNPTNVAVVAASAPADFAVCRREDA
jgi:hypothetical protein